MRINLERQHLRTSEARFDRRLSLCRGAGEFRVALTRVDITQIEEPARMVHGQHDPDFPSPRHEHRCSRPKEALPIGGIVVASRSGAVPIVPTKGVNGQRMMLAR